MTAGSFRIDEQFAAYPEVAIRLHLKIGETYRMLGKDSPRVARLLGKLAGV